MKKAIALVILLMFAPFACYNTYYISMDELRSLESSETGSKTVRAGDLTIEVTQSTRLFVRALDGKRYPITPFNFKLTRSQLVAPDRDYIFMLNELEKRGEIDLLSTWKTAGLIALAGAAVTGIIIVTVATAGRKSFSSPGGGQ